LELVSAVRNAQSRTGNFGQNSSQVIGRRMQIPDGAVALAFRPKGIGKFITLPASRAPLK
jgi:hypothetical protein